jgi:hypothetical protein
MPKKPAIDTSKLNQIDAYTYPDHDRANNPPVGMARYDTAASPEGKYAYDPLDAGTKSNRHTWTQR